MNQNKITIFLADDDEDDRYFFNSALLQLNLNTELLSFVNGEELISHVQATNKTPDLIFLDINMPKTDGIECLKSLKKIAPGNDLTVVMLSTASEKSIIDLTREHGASAYIEKPTHLKELIKYLSYCLLHLKTDLAQKDFLLNTRLKNV